MVFESISARRFIVLKLDTIAFYGESAGSALRCLDCFPSGHTHDHRTLPEPPLLRRTGAAGRAGVGAVGMNDLRLLACSSVLVIDHMNELVLESHSECGGMIISRNQPMSTRELLALISETTPRQRDEYKITNTSSSSYGNWIDAKDLKPKQNQPFYRGLKKYRR